MSPATRWDLGGTPAVTSSLPIVVRGIGGARVGAHVREVEHPMGVLLGFLAEEVPQVIIRQSHQVVARKKAPTSRNLCTMQFSK